MTVAASFAFAQPAARFDVASIKPASSVEIDAIRRSGRSSLFPEQGISISGTRVTVRGLTALTLIRAAYNLRSYQLSGGPDWIANEPYDIAAKGERGSPLTLDQVRPMLQDLLAERFQLKFHRQSKEGAAYALVLGRTGLKLRESVAAEYSTHVTAGPAQIHVMISKGTMAQFCGRLSTFVNQPVIDRTNLRGAFDLKLDFAPEGLESEFPSLFTAVQEQLGLKLESTKAPVEILVIDRIEHPSGN